MRRKKKYPGGVIPATVIFFFCLGGCADTPRNRTPADESLPEPSERARTEQLAGTIVKPSDGDDFVTGEEIEINFSFDQDAGNVESLNMTVDGSETVFKGSISGGLIWDSSGQPVGSRRIRLEIEYADGTTETYPVNIVLKSDIIPRKYTYNIINSYPHDIRAFTQGLVYYGGFLYESTGRYGQSTLRKVDVETGGVLRSLKLERDLFGEGLCVHDDKLYQLTWKSKVGFIYDIETFRMLSRVYYDTEGWGLTSDGSNLLKSDGSHYIYVLDPQYFSETDKFEVFDNNGRVQGLNELEFIDGTVYANVYGTDEIAMIDRESGRLEGIIDLKGLLDRRYRHPELDVLNGIAWDHENDRLFVTGKNWPRLFEIEVVPE
ncbi:MAG: glutaminyl-peptide cyclotransferase [Bacteroidales bacterium]